MTTIFSNKETDTVKGKLFIHTKTSTTYYGAVTKTMAIEMALKTTGLTSATWNGKKLPVNKGIH